MNFIKAIQHATIGYGIRRAEWVRTQPDDWPDLILHLDCDGLRWVNTPDGRANVLLPPVKLCGEDINYDLLVQDITADDWQVV